MEEETVTRVKRLEPIVLQGDCNAGVAVQKVCCAETVTRVWVL